MKGSDRHLINKTVIYGVRHLLQHFLPCKIQRNYAFYGEKHYPIGSGGTVAACITIIKQRLCCSGMRWKETGAAQG